MQHAQQTARPDITKTISHHRRGKGFTLIELMIVVAILGVISSIALTSYSQFVSTAQGGTMVHNFEVAVDTARTSYAAARQRVAMGIPANTVIPANSADWVALLNQDNRSAPAGGDPYEVGTGNVNTGAVGLVFSGSYANRDSTLTIHRPAFAGVPEGSILVAQANF